MSTTTHSLGYTIATLSFQRHTLSHRPPLAEWRPSILLQDAHLLLHRHTKEAYDKVGQCFGCRQCHGCLMFLSYGVFDFRGIWSTTAGTTWYLAYPRWNKKNNTSMIILPISRFVAQRMFLGCYRSLQMKLYVRWLVHAIVCSIGMQCRRQHTHTA